MNRIPWRGILVGLCALTALCALRLAPATCAPYTTIVFEAENVRNLTGRAFHIAKFAENANGKVSGNQVLEIAKLAPGEKVAKDEITYHVKVPKAGIYYFWARTYWANGCGNSFWVKVEGYDTGENAWVLGGDGTYNSMHWVNLNDGSNNSKPRPLRLHSGQVTITLIAKEGGVKADQFLLTSDSGKTPAGVYKPTPDALVFSK